MEVLKKYFGFISMEFFEESFGGNSCNIFLNVWRNILEGVMDEFLVQIFSKIMKEYLSHFCGNFVRIFFIDLVGFFQVKLFLEHFETNFWRKLFV